MLVPELKSSQRHPPSPKELEGNGGKNRENYVNGSVSKSVDICVENGHSYRKELSRSLKNNLEFCRKT